MNRELRLPPLTVEDQIRIDALRTVQEAGRFREQTQDPVDGPKGDLLQQHMQMADERDAYAFTRASQLGFSTERIARAYILGIRVYRAQQLQRRQTK